MTDLLKKNLKALRTANPQSAELLCETTPADCLTFVDSKQGPVSGIYETSLEGKLRKTTLASRFKPLDEAERLAESVDVEANAAIMVMGFGLGHHLRPILERAAGKALVVVYEPDAPLLRAVIEEQDLTDVLAHRSFMLFTGDIDAASLTTRLEPHTSAIIQGVQFITHPPTRQLQADAITRFTESFSKFASYCRTNLATTLVNASATCRNLTQNLGQYAAGSTTDPIHDIARGKPAVLVSAGPSLAKNVHLLAQPGIRDRVIIIAVQTTLKPLLDRDIRPHFVTALDYHEISKRFYEDLPSLQDVTLVAEPKAHRAILDHYPGPIRILQNRFLDVLLGPLARPIKPIKAGSTVAHLSLYLAQHLGCDPIIMIGQDLGFSDGLYYCPGTAIHDIWAPELNSFNTLEVMEFKRILRHKAHLKKRVDQHDRPIYSDEQMLTYLNQFERDFAAAPQTIVDATEGGLPKQHTVVKTLDESLDQYATTPLQGIPEPSTALDSQRLADTATHLKYRIDQVDDFQATSEQTLPLLKQMLLDQRDPKKMNRHFAKVEKLQKRVADLGEVFTLVNELNQVGAFKRTRADRAITATDGLDPYEKQARQLHRDIENVEWLVEACQETSEIFQSALDRITTQLRSSCRLENPARKAIA